MYLIPQSLPLLLTVSQWVNLKCYTNWMIQLVQNVHKKPFLDTSRTKIFSARYAAERLATVCSSRHSSSRLLSCEDCDRDDCDDQDDLDHGDHGMIMVPASSHVRMIVMIVIVVRIMVTIGAA